MLADLRQTDGAGERRRAARRPAPDRSAPLPKALTVKTVHPVTDQLEPEPLDPGQIVSGTPETSALTLAESDEGAESGLWRCTPGVVTDTEVEESFLVITGRGRIDFEDGTSVELSPGCLLYTSPSPRD